MADSLPFSPEFMAKLATKRQFLEPAAKAVSQFAKFPGPDGRYFARFIKIVGSFDAKLGHPRFVFAFNIIAMVETGSQEFAGHPVRINFNCKASEKQTEQESWNRLFTDGYQAMGIATAAWKDVPTDLPAATAWLNQQKFPVILSVSENAKDPRFKNINIVEVLQEAAVAQFSVPEINVTDDAITQEDESASTLPDEVSDDFLKSFKEAEAYLLTLDRDALLVQCAQSQVELADPSGTTDEALRTMILASYVQKAERDPADFGLVVPSADQADFPLAEEAPFDTGAALAEAIDEEEEEAEEEELDDDEAAKLQRLHVLLVSMDRTALKKARMLYGETTFFKSDTDEKIRDGLREAVIAANFELKWL